MIFVTLGSQKFQFNRLLKKIDDLIDEGIIDDEVFAQIGVSNYVPKNYRYVDFMSSDQFAEMERKADLVITHGGTGAIIGAVKKGKRVIAVPRLKEFGEHVDDHQIQLLEQFEEMRIIMSCYDLDKLREVYQKIQTIKPIEYQSNTGNIICSIENYLLGLKKQKGSFS